jgi:hypothetical protein
MEILGIFGIWIIISFLVLTGLFLDKTLLKENPLFMIIVVIVGIILTIMLSGRSKPIEHGQAFKKVSFFWNILNKFSIAIPSADEMKEMTDEKRAKEIMDKRALKFYVSALVVLVITRVFQSMSPWLDRFGNYIYLIVGLIFLLGLFFIPKYLIRRQNPPKVK